MMPDFLLLLLAANGVYFWRARRRLNHLKVVDFVLTKVCTEAFMQRGLPVWLAWHGPMGNVEVSAQRKEWDDV